MVTILIDVHVFSNPPRDQDWNCICHSTICYHKEQGNNMFSLELFTN